MPFEPVLPPIRKLILPDPGWVLVDADFDRADAQIVAWSADEPELKTIFQRGVDVHTENAEWCSRRSGKKVIRQDMKAGIHLTNYGGKASTLATTLGVDRETARAFQEYWFGRFPGVHKWHEKTRLELKLQHHIRNVWGFRRFYFDRLQQDVDVERLLPQALAWLGQSGVAIAINHAMKNVRRTFTRDEVRLRLQVHDSLLLQVREDLAPKVFPTIREAMRVRIPFDDPLYIPVSIKWSLTSWGDVKKWEEAA